MRCTVLINGRPIHWIDCADRGFQYGDGLFETISIYDGVPLFLSKHIDRLAEGCRRLAIELPERNQIAAEAEMLCRSVDEGVLKIQVTRGKGGRGYRCPNDSNSTRVLSVHPSPNYPPELKRNGIKARVCKTRLGINPRLAAIKHMNRLEQILATREWDDPRIHEGLMLDTDNCVVEGTRSNLFLVKNGRLLTPKIDRCGVAGIVRALVIEQAQVHDIKVALTRITIDDLLDADELFLTNSIIGYWPITELENIHYPSGTVTQQIGHWIDRLKQNEIHNQ
jgi:4-amino-4-deoxychorismate lyase